MRQIVIPLSGIGQRFISAGYTTPKPLIEVDGKPIIAHVIDLFPNETNFVFICNDLHLKTTNMKQILIDLSSTCTIVEVSVNNRKGPVHAISQAYDYINNDDEIIVSYCDYGTQWDYNGFLDEIHKNNADGAIAAYIGFHPHMLGSDNYAFMRHENMIMQEIQEKRPFTNNKMQEYASNGTYYFKSGKILKEYFDEAMLKGLHTNGEYYVSMVYNLLVNDNKKVLIYEIQKMLQWGTPYDLQVYNMWSDYFKAKQKPIDTSKYKNNITTILPMAGKGNRFKMVGYDIPKPFLQVENLPMVVQALNSLPNTQNTEIITLKEHYNDYNEQFIILNANIHIIDDVTDGQATTCSTVVNKLDDSTPIIISACDNGAYYDIDKFFYMINDESIDVIVWSFTNNPTSKLYPEMYAWLDVDENDNIKYVSVKKPLKDKINKHAIIGTMYFKQSKYFKDGYQYITKNKIQTNGEYYVDDMLNYLIESGLTVKVFPVDFYLCWGTPNDYKTYLYWSEYFMK